MVSSVVYLFGGVSLVTLGYLTYSILGWDKPKAWRERSDAERVGGRVSPTELSANLSAQGGLSAASAVKANGVPETNFAVETQPSLAVDRSKERVASEESPIEAASELSRVAGLRARSDPKEDRVREANLETAPEHALWENRDYYWVVLCKNHGFHSQDNPSYRHRIALGGTDAFSPPPALKGPFRVRCDSCGREYQYTPSELLRSEADLPESFRPHPLFQE